MQATGLKGRCAGRQAGGTFWLRRLTHAGEEQALQAAAWALLARLASAAAPATRGLLLHGWPGCAAAAMQVHPSVDATRLKASTLLILWMAVTCCDLQG